MDGPEILASFSEDLATRLSSYRAPKPVPVAISPWLAMSLLQKSIRRGNERLALQATATLLRDAPHRLWKRCATIAFEDGGVADLSAVALVVAALAGTTARSRMGSEWSVASYLVERLVAAPKCRAADDLVMVIERHPSLERARRNLLHEPIDGLIGKLTSDAPLPTRALATWYAIGTERCPSDHLRPKRGLPFAVFDRLCDVGFPQTAVEIAHEGFRKTNQILCPLLPLLISEKPCEPTAIEDDEYPPEVTFGDLPSWAVDMFTREGREALRRFLGRDCRTSQWVRRYIPATRQIDFLGYILFAVEGGLLKQRYRWPLGDELRRMAEVESQGPYCPDATEILSLMRGDIDLLNEERSHVL